MKTSAAPDRPVRKMVSLRLSAKARELLSALAAREGVSQAAVLEGLLRRAADEPGKAWDQSGAPGLPR